MEKGKRAEENRAIRAEEMRLKLSQGKHLRDIEDHLAEMQRLAELMALPHTPRDDLEPGEKYVPDMNPRYKAKVDTLDRIVARKFQLVNKYLGDIKHETVDQTLEITFEDRVEAIRRKMSPSDYVNAKKAGTLKAVA